jgi:hypothetical protein
MRRYIQPSDKFEDTRYCMDIINLIICFQHSVVFVLAAAVEICITDVHFCHYEVAFFALLV